MSVELIRVLLCLLFGMVSAEIVSMLNAARACETAVASSAGPVVGDVDGCGRVWWPEREWGGEGGALTMGEEEGR